MSTVDPTAPRAPFDKATVEADRLHGLATPPLPAQLKDYLRNLKFLPSSAILVSGLFLLAALHGVGLLLFTRGFLLTRRALDEVNTCNPISPSGNLDASCTLPATHSKLVLIVIDALRADFVLPVNASQVPPSPYHHNRLTLPARLTQHDPSRSFLSHFIADAPTTTLQRLKGLTTGSLPTFVDAGSNFAGERVDEDNWLWQAKRAGKRIALVGDDTWLAVYPQGGNDSVWSKDLVWPYDSFSVEDLDTVDNGVVDHLIPLLDQNLAGTASWDIVIAHTLGLDHAGHRFGPHHAEAQRKLAEAEVLLQNVVDRLDDDTLLVVMGDHGMTDRGDHGGDSREEVDAALWIYSKGPVLTHPSFHAHPLDSPLHPIASLLAKARLSPDLQDQLELDWPQKGLASTRSVSQVDLVPTLSLLLGLPIPFGSLGLVIPDVFYRPTSLPVAPVPEDPTKPKPRRGFFSSGDGTPKQRAMETLSSLSTLTQASLLTSAQLSHYLAAYTATPSGSDLLPAMPELSFILAMAKSAFRGVHAPGAVAEEMETKALEKFWSYGRKAREQARKVWARFDTTLMLAGVVIWVGSLAVGAKLFAATQNGSQARELLGMAFEGLLVSAWGMFALWLLGVFDTLGGLSGLKAAFMTALIVEVSVIVAPLRSASRTPFKWTTLTSFIPVVAHSALFASNSFTVFEDSAVLFMLSTLLIVTFVRALSAPEARLRKRLMGFSLTALACVRLMAWSTICREEQAPFCVPTFDLAAGSNIALVVIGLALVAAWFIPTLLRSSLALSAADTGISPVYFNIVLRLLLVGGALYYAADWSIAGSTRAVGDMQLASVFKTGVARAVMAGSLMTALVLWHYCPLCIEVKQEESKAKSGAVQVSIVGFANTFGSSYLIFFSALFALIFLVNPPPAQLVLTLHLITLLCLLEIFDSERDVEFMKSSFAKISIDTLLSTDSTALPVAPAHSGPTFVQLSTLALLSHVAFFATGHQATFASLQWKSAFIGFSSIVYPFSPLLVVLNTTGPHFITALSIPLFVFWNLTPTFKNQRPLPVLRSLLKAGIGYSSYQATISLASAAFAGVLRRHLMVWKIFAPRFMLGAISIVVVDVVLILFAMGWAGLGTINKVKSRVGTVVVE